MDVKGWVRSKINRHFYLNPRFEPLVWRLYYSPDPRRRNVLISDEAESWLSTFRRDGILILPGRFAALADHLQRDYLDPLVSGKQPSHDFMTPLALPTGREANLQRHIASLSFADPQLAPLLFDPDLCGLIYNYYQRQPFYRQRPTVETASAHSIAKLSSEPTTKFHIDQYHQLSHMLLINELTDKTTHLQFAKRSHLDRQSWDRFSYDDAAVESRYEIVKGIGPKGTLILFDSGNGLHRGRYFEGTTRSVLHTVITTGHMISERVEPRWPERDTFPEHVRRMTDAVVR